MAKQMSRRDFLKAAGFTTAALTLAACAPAASAPAATQVSGPTAQPPAAQNVTLEFWTFNDYATGKTLEIFKGWIAKFESANPGIKVNITGKPGSDILANVITGASSGDLPDALQIQLGVGGDLIAINALVDMAPYWGTMSKDFQGQFNKGALDPCIQNGKVYGLPFSAYAAILFRNLKVLKKAGIDPAAGVKDWDDFASQLDKIQKAGLKGTGKILGSDWTQLHFYGGIPGTSKARIAPDGKSTMLKADAYTTLFDYLLKIKPYCVGSNEGDTATADLFMSDQLGFVSMGPWLAPTLDEAKAKSGLEYDAIEIPGQTADSKGSIRGGEFTGICSPKNKDAAWKWVSFISDYPQEASWAAQIGRLMANDKALEQPDAKANWLVQLTGKAFNTAVDETLFMKKVATGFGQPEVDYGNQIDTGALKPADAAPKMIDAINKILSAG
jgi:multiple sugar transport system substrate-binding protein